MKIPPLYRLVEDIATGGSAREFFRVKKNRMTYILIRGDGLNEYSRIQRHLRRLKISVPRIHQVYRDSVIIEDLGDRSLYRIARKEPKNMTRFYKKTIRELVNLQLNGRLNAPIERYYDYEHIRWEQDYFRKFFLGQFCGLDRGRLRSLDPDFKRLARAVVLAIAPFHDFFMHRDCQSQNIIFKRGRPWFIDFQSARIGPLTYDLASLLKDPYVPISKTLEITLINYYLLELKNKQIDVDKIKFLEAYHLSSLQRIMQALGAFANLSLNKGKSRFRRHIPRGITRLISELKNTPYRQLYATVKKIDYARRRFQSY
jgi:aminoglycoside/choline kinase family phosphotransferase